MTVGIPHSYGKDHELDVLWSFSWMIGPRMKISWFNDTVLKESRPWTSQQQQQQQQQQQRLWKSWYRRWVCVATTGMSVCDYLLCKSSKSSHPDQWWAQRTAFKWKSVSRSKVTIEGTRLAGWLVYPSYTLCQMLLLPVKWTINPIWFIETLNAN